MSFDNEKISSRAYQLFQERFGGQAPLDDWLKAEREIINSNAEETGKKSSIPPDRFFPSEI
jgi:hypothetical protein